DQDVVVGDVGAGVVIWNGWGGGPGGGEQPAGSRGHHVVDRSVDHVVGQDAGGGVLQGQSARDGEDPELLARELGEVLPADPGVAAVGPDQQIALAVGAVGGLDPDPVAVHG